MRRNVVYFATGNIHKVEEAKEILNRFSLDVKQLNLKGEEIQANTVEEVAKNSARRAAERKHPINS